MCALVLPRPAGPKSSPASLNPHAPEWIPIAGEVRVLTWPCMTEKREVAFRLVSQPQSFMAQGRKCPTGQGSTQQ